MQRLTLKAGDLAVEILPDLGGAIARFTSEGAPIFRETPAAPASVSECASFPLIPFSNRVRAGHFSFAGQARQIPVDARDPRFTNHGHTRHLPWQVIASTATSALLRFIQPAPAPAWPFAFTAEQEFLLSPDAFVMRARLRNDQAEPAPAGIGFHPYFTRQPGSTLQFSAATLWRTDQLDIPIASASPAGRFDFSTARQLDASLINHAYGGWNGMAEIVHPDFRRISITASKALGHLILFTPEGKDFFGFEPVSHRPDALNPLPDPQDQGMAVLPPGAWLEGEVRIKLAP